MLLTSAERFSIPCWFIFPALSMYGFICIKYAEFQFFSMFFSKMYYNELSHLYVPIEDAITLCIFLTSFVVKYENCVKFICTSKVGIKMNNRTIFFDFLHISKVQFIFLFLSLCTTSFFNLYFMYLPTMYIHY